MKFAYTGGVKTGNDCHRNIKKALEPQTQKDGDLMVKDVIMEARKAYEYFE